jgi:hypothetical protein
VAGHSTGDNSACPCSTRPAVASTASRMDEQHRRSARLSSVHRLGHSARSTAEWCRVVERERKGGILARWGEVLVLHGASPDGLAGVVVDEMKGGVQISTDLNPKP